MGGVRHSKFMVLATVGLAVLAAMAIPVGSASARDQLPSPDVIPFGDASMNYGSTSSINLASPVVGIVRTPDGGGYWEVAADGGVFSFGDARFFGSMGGMPLAQPVVGMAASPDGGGYWEVAADGGVFSFGDARFFGSMGGMPLAQPVTGMGASPDGDGYWEVAADGGIFSFGDARFFGSMGGTPLAQPVTGMAASPDGDGYWEVAADGGIFSFGDARFFGSMGGTPLAQPVTGMAASPDGDGYWEVAADGGIFSFGDARFFGSFTGGVPAEGPAYTRFVGMAPTSDGGGYWLVASGFCASAGTTLPQTSAGSGTGVASLSDLSVSPDFSCAGQVRFQFQSPAPAAVGYDIRYVSGPVTSPSGQPIHMAGNAFLQITLHPAQSNDYTGPLDIVSSGAFNIVEVRQTQNFEGYMTWVVGLNHQGPVWVGQPNPGGSQSLVVNIS